MKSVWMNIICTAATHRWNILSFSAIKYNLTTSIWINKFSWKQTASISSFIDSGLLIVKFWVNPCDCIVIYLRGNDQPISQVILFALSSRQIDGRTDYNVFQNIQWGEFAVLYNESMLCVELLTSKDMTDITVFTTLAPWDNFPHTIVFHYHYECFITSV